VEELNVLIFRIKFKLWGRIKPSIKVKWNGFKSEDIKNLIEIKKKVKITPVIKIIKNLKKIKSNQP